MRAVNEPIKTDVLIVGAGNSGAAVPVTGAIHGAAQATGAGIDVALVDSGVSPVTGLNAKNKVVNGPDISFDSQAKNKDAYVDNYGHGTHIAGIIAGNGGDKRDDFTGIAPDARLLNAGFRLRPDVQRERVGAATANLSLCV